MIARLLRASDVQLTTHSYGVISGNEVKWKAITRIHKNTHAPIVFNSHKLKKLIMFDITNREIREQKLKFIEILLVVGGIIGGLRLQNENDPMNITFGLFLMGSLVYYFMLSNTKINSMAVSRSVLIGFIMAISFTSFGFSAIAILPFIIKGITTLIGELIMIIWLLLSVLIFISLYR